jgi:hypothetical protein
LEGHQIVNILKNEIQDTSQKPFFFNPSISLNWEINKNNQISTSYSINKSNTKIIDVYNNYILTSARTLEKGYGNFNQLSTSTFIANYQLGNWNDKYFINSLLFYTKNHDFFSTNKILNRNYFQSEKLLIKNREIIKNKIQKWDILKVKDISIDFLIICKEELLMYLIHRLRSKLEISEINTITTLPFSEYLHSHINENDISLFQLNYQ